MNYQIREFKHIPGKNCVTTALRNILNYYHILLSEELILGLAGGLGFYYVELPEFPNPFIGGNSSNLIGHFCQNMDLQLFELRKKDPEAAHKAMVGKILSDIPVIIKIDLYYLDYFRSKFHFSGHRIIPVGIDDEHVYVADTGFRSIKQTSIENFKKGRASDYGPQPPGNLQLFINRPEKDLPILDNLWGIVRRNARQMISSPDGNGLISLEKFASSADKFTNPEYLLIQIEKAGTGGALGRRMYRDFLSEANLYRPHQTLLEAYKLYAEVVETYEQIVTELRQGSMPDLKEPLMDVLDYERKAAEMLADL
ncbi:MAG: BtrH N-terminal domain-containing protein [candidate division Zixibacteria bacterium]|nr:BtrH N-terminal domain-containing protein [candidate division Zixibacteria bacterium]NIT51582.1 BtrH N-terminal domain-containing protein [candidate division Zixibacteria bacterium]NIW39056.1 DUF4872 domain-containing protein [candidate division Zixibacteria bacterium]NIX58638.1 DUF4872 domain-containing protein [candidate division Zixibacteria bacterium]